MAHFLISVDQGCLAHGLIHVFAQKLLFLNCDANGLLLLSTLLLTNVGILDSLAVCFLILLELSSVVHGNFRALSHSSTLSDEARVILAVLVMPKSIFVSWFSTESCRRHKFYS